MRAPTTILSFVLCAYLSACAGPEHSANTQLLPTSDAAASPAGASQNLPFPPDRGSAALTEDLILGKDTYSRGGTAFDDGTALELESTPGNMSYGIWRFNTENELRYVEVRLSVQGSDVAYVALANFGDGSWDFSDEVDSTHVLALTDDDHRSSDGSFYIAVIVTMGDDATVEALNLLSDFVNTPPVAELIGGPPVGNIPLTVIFDAGTSSDSDGTIIEYAWDFDGNNTYEETSDSSEVLHVYKEPGIFFVQVRVTDNSLATALSDFVQITVTVAGNNPPLAALSPTSASGSFPLPITFDAGDSGAGGDSGDSIVLYEWDFEGDGSFDSYGSQPTQDYTYNQIGEYAPIVRVTDEAGNQAQAKRRGASARGQYAGGRRRRPRGLLLDLEHQWRTGHLLSGEPRVTALCARAR